MSTTVTPLEDSRTTVLRDLRDWIHGEEAMLPRVAIACFVSYALWMLVTPSGPTHKLLSELYNIAVPLAATAALWVTARHPALDQRTREAWLAFGFGTMALGISASIWFIDDYVIGARPAVSLVGALYLLYYPFFLVGLFRFPTAQRSRRDIIKLWLDVGTVVVAGAAVIWYVILGPAVRAGSSTLPEILFSAAYPIGDLVLMFTSTVVLLHRPAVTSRWAIQLIILSNLGPFGSDLVLGYQVLHTGIYQKGNWTDLGWQSAMLLWILAAMHQRWQMNRSMANAKAATDVSFEISAVPYVAVMVGYGLLLIVSRPAWTTSLGAVIGAVLLLTGFVMVRQFIAVRENVQLLTERMAVEAHFRTLVQNSSDVITVVDEQNIIQFMSPAVERVFGWLPSTAIGKSITDIVHRDDGDAVVAFLANLQADLQAGRSTTVQLVLRCRNSAGEWRHAETIATGLAGDVGVGHRSLVLNTRDVSERMELQAELTHQAYHDPLTGLANRAWFRLRVEEALARTHAAPEHVVVFFLDLDTFKYINDSLGHSEGDQVLTAVSTRLLNATRGSDTVARLGGDEFAVLVNRITTEQDLIVIAERIANAMKFPFLLHNGEVFSSTSIGIARGIVAQTVDDLLRNADVAMYVSKRQGRGLYTIFEPIMHADARQRLELETDLRHALLRNELALVFQPIIDLKTRFPIGVEALVRWHHPRRGLIGPNDFIPLAEESGLILPLGRWVLMEACRHGARWSAMLPLNATFMLAVNVSGTQLQQATFVEEVAAALRETGLSPSMLLLEITEGVIVRNTALTRERLIALKTLGVRLAIDDFGTGYSSLSFLQQFPIDVLKIDKSFVDNATTTGNGPALARTIIALGETLSLQTVAEGVEYAQQADVLAAMGCDTAQGFHFSQPVPPAEIDALMRGTLAFSNTDGQAA